MGVATAQARPYYLFTRWLRSLKVRFDVISPHEIASYAGDVILTTRTEAGCCAGKALLYIDEIERGPAIAQILLLRRCGMFGGDTIVGIDPGRRLGVSVFYGGLELERELFVSADRMVSHVSDLLEHAGPGRRTIRIGDGDMARALAIREMFRRIAAPSRIELVDESGTSPRGRHCNGGGKRDMLAARAIAMRGSAAA